MGIIEMIEENGEVLFSDIWGERKANRPSYADYKALVKKILTEEFDCIILIDRKGSAIFRSFLRVLKESGELDGIKFPTILGSRVDGYYELGDARLCIFDDIVNRRRNLERIVTNLHRRGIRKISFSAFGYAKTLFSNVELEEGKVYEKLCVKPDKDYNEIEDKHYLYKLNDYIEMPLVYTDKLSLRKETLLDVAETKTLSKVFNKFIHHCSVPYTSYTTYSRFIAKKDALVVSNEYRTLPYSVAACAEVGVDANLYFKNGDSCYENGFFKAFRVFFNRSTEEWLIRPCIFLPSLTESQVEHLLNSLGFSEVPKIVYTKGAKQDELREGESVDDPKYLAVYKKKNELETKMRLLVSVLAVKFGIDFVNSLSKDDALISTAKSAFIKAFARFFDAEKYRNYSNSCNGEDDDNLFNETFKELIARLECAISTIDSDNSKPNSEKFFDFSNTDIYSAPNEDLLLNYTEFKDELGKASDVAFLEGIIKNTGDNSIGDKDYVALTFIDELLSEICLENSDDLARFFSRISLKLNEIDNNHYKDSKLRYHKLPPIPLLETIQKVSKKHCRPEFLFPLAMAAFDACVEDGSLSDCVYAEKHCESKLSDDYNSYTFKDSDKSFDKPVFRVSYHYQHGELSPLERFKRFCAKIRFFVDEVNKSLWYYKETILESDEQEILDIKKAFDVNFESKMVDAFKNHEFDISNFLRKNGMEFVYSKDVEAIKNEVSKPFSESNKMTLNSLPHNDLLCNFPTKEQYSFADPSYDDTAIELSLLLKEWRKILFLKCSCKGDL